LDVAGLAEAGSEKVRVSDPGYTKWLGSNASGLAPRIFIEQESLRKAGQGKNSIYSVPSYTVASV
jgi:hypothetical protein